jgi:hypothetical protein
MLTRSVCHRVPVERRLGYTFIQMVLRDIPNSRLYVELRELDLRIEQFSNRKKAEICDLSQEIDLKTRCLRLHCFNRHFHQVRRFPCSG